MKKIIAMLLVFSMVMLLASCAAASDKEGSGLPSTKVQTEEETKSTEEVVDKSYEEAYAALASDFKKVIEFRLSENYRQSSWYQRIATVEFSDTFKAMISSYGEEEVEGAVSYALDELLPSEDAGVEDFGYILHDFNGDKVPEMFWVRKDHSIVAIFSLQNDGVKLADCFWSRNSAYVSSDGKLYSWGISGAQDMRCSTLELNPDGTFDAPYGFSSATDIFGDPTQAIYYEYASSSKTEITKEKFASLSEKYPAEQSDFWMNLPILELK